MKKKEINPYLKLQITSEIMSIQNFKVVCEMAAKKDDGKIDADEEKVLSEIRKSSDKFLKVLHELI